MIDTDIVVAAVRSRKGASAALLAYLIEGHATLPLSVALALEYETIALLPEHVMAGGTTLATVGNLIDALIDIAEPVKMSFQYRPQLSDPGDEIVLEAAINGHAEAIVSFNSKDYRKEGKIFLMNLGLMLSIRQKLCGDFAYVYTTVRKGDMNMTMGCSLATLYRAL